MNFQTTYYFGNQAAARQLARQATAISGGAILTESEGYWTGDTMVLYEGANVMVLHSGGIIDGKLRNAARQAAADFGEAEVLQVTMETVSTGMLEAKDYNA